MSVFKAYDIRGIWDRDWNRETVYAIGRWLPSLLKAERFLVGRDIRLSSETVRDALIQGLSESGASVDDIGLSTTPMVYFFTARNHYDASVQITASHNPAEYNGLKISRTSAVPVGYDSGLEELEKKATSGTLPPFPEKPGTVQKVECVKLFLDWLKSQDHDLEGLTFAVDCSDGMAGLFIRDLFGSQPVYLNDKPDGSFPHHAPNPLEISNCRQLAETVRAQKLDLGVIFDGDADRVMFVDETGTFIQPDYLIPLIVSELSDAREGDIVLHDIRTSKGVSEILSERGFRPYIWKVGHAFAKRKLKELDAIFGGELAGHYYFRDFFNCDSGELAALKVLSAAAKAKREGVRFSELIRPVMRYANSGELNYTIDRKNEAIDAVVSELCRKHGTPEKQYDFDGIRMEWKDFWFSLRKSNTEPYLRLILEAKTHERLTLIRGEIELILKDFIHV